MRLRAALLALLLIALTGCGSKSTPTAPTSAAPAANNPPPAAAATATPAAAAATGTTFAIDPAQSKATYTVREKFANKELPNDAVGSTNNIQGQIHLHPGANDPAIRVDLRTLTSDSSRRDNRIKTVGLESTTYPYADFKLEKVEGLDPLPAAGQKVAVKLSGQMTLHNSTQPFTFTGDATLEGGRLHLTVGNVFDMTQFQISPPSLAGILTVEPSVKLQVDVVAAPGQG